MTKIVNARLKASGKRQTFETDTLDIKYGDKIVVHLESGVDIATVVSATAKNEESCKKSLKQVLRIATDEDVKNDKDNIRLEEEGRIFCQKKIEESGLPMRLVGTKITLDKKKFVFYFTAEKRVDFRELVKELASKFRTRIELRQIGIRDEAKFLGGVGSCGREVCCKLFLTRFAPISIRMAKKQDITLNPSKLSGLCGRLMCCLSYEHTKEKKACGKGKPAGRAPKVDTLKNKKTDKEIPATYAQATEETSAGRPVKKAGTNMEKPESTEAPSGKSVQKKARKAPRRRRRSARKKS